MVQVVIVVDFVCYFLTGLEQPNKLVSLGLSVDFEHDLVLGEVAEVPIDWVVWEIHQLWLILVEDFNAKQVFTKETNDKPHFVG